MYDLLAQQQQAMARRQFLFNSACGVGTVALASLLEQDAAQAKESNEANPLAPQESHFPAKAKNCIFIFLAGGPSHLDLYDPKPKLVEHHEQPLPKELLEKVRFAFIQKETATLIGSPRKFKRQGECGTE